MRGRVAPICEGIWYGLDAVDAAAAEDVGVALTIGRRAGVSDVAEDVDVAELAKAEAGLGLGVAFAAAEEEAAAAAVAVAADADDLLPLAPAATGWVLFASILNPYWPCSPEFR
jgi:hypothetical protein